MSNSAFLKNFITEDIYVIDGIKTAKNEVKEPASEYTPEVKPVKNLLPVTEVDEVSLNLKGSNNKGVAIIVNYSDQEYIDSADEAFLLKILSAVKFTAEDVAIINLAKTIGLTHQNFEILDSSTCLIFDEKSALTQSLNPYEITSHEGINLLWSQPLNIIAKDNVQKKLLWEALQKLFLK
jgi:hypothetical protein